MTDVAKRLAFDDLSLPLNHFTKDDAITTSNVKSKLEELVRAYEKLSKLSEERTTAAKDNAVKQIQAGGKLLLKRQIQSLKSSLQNLGQKECFSDAILNFTEDHDFKAEAERITTVLDSYEEDLKDVKKANHQDEEHLREAIQTIEAYHDQHQQVLSRLAQRLDTSSKELLSMEAGGLNRMPLLSPLPAPDMTEAELESLIASQTQLAANLEVKLAQVEAGCRDLEGDLQAGLTEASHMEAELARLEIGKQDEERVAEENYNTSIAWCDTMMNIINLVTGVTLVSIEEDNVTVCIRQAAATTQGDSVAVRDSTKEHVLTMTLKSGSSSLEKATLVPASINVSELVLFAKETGGGLPLLLTMVRDQLWDKLLNDPSRKTA